MKLRKLFSVLMAGALFAACQKPSVETVTFVVDRLLESYEFAGEVEGNAEFHVDATAEWSIKFDKAVDWVTISPMRSVGGSQTVKISVKPNTGTDPREVGFQVVCGEKSYKSKIVQKGSAVVCTVDKKSVSFDFTGSPEVEVVLTTSAGWIASADSWIVLSETSGKAGENRIKVSAAENTASSPRNDEIVFSCMGESASVAVSQEGKPDKIYHDIKAGPVVFETGDAVDVSAIQGRQKEWASKGKLTADNCRGVWAEFVQNEANKSFANQPGFSFEADPTKCFTLKCMFTGDALVFHVPVVSVDAGSKIEFKANNNITGTASKYYAIEYSLDGGSTWTTADTGKESVTAPNGKSSNFSYTAKGTSAINAEFPVATALNNSEILVRILCVDGTSTPNGDITEPGTSFNFKLGAQKETAGISFGLASDKPEPEPETSWYDFADGALTMKTNDGSSGLSGRQADYEKKGIAHFDNADYVTISFQQNPANKIYSAQPVFKFSKDIGLMVNSAFTGDAFVATIPVKSIAAGKTIRLESALRVSGTTGAFFMVEYSVDGGSTWTRANTGNSIVQSTYLKADSNFQITAKGTAVPLTADCAITSALTKAKVLIRVTLTDGRATINGDQTEPSATGTLGIGNASGAEGITISLR